MAHRFHTPETLEAEANLLRIRQEFEDAMREALLLYMRREDAERKLHEAIQRALDHDEEGRD